MYYLLSSILVICHRHFSPLNLGTLVLPKEFKKNFFFFQRFSTQHCWWQNIHKLWCNQKDRLQFNLCKLPPYCKVEATIARKFLPYNRALINMLHSCWNHCHLSVLSFNSAQGMDLAMRFNYIMSYMHIQSMFNRSFI